jgi:cell division protein FtsB
VQFNYQSGQSSIGSERLRKAIERNRAKQEKKDKQEKIEKRGAQREVPVESPTRVSVARSAQESQFVSPLKKEKSNFSFGLNYKEKKSIPMLSASSGLKNKFAIVLPVWARKLGWILCAIIFVRLIFSSGGLIDFYSKNNVYKSFEAELAGYETENSGLKEEIQKISNSSTYQKKLVRDHLGFISKEEFLILFASEK